MAPKDQWIQTDPVLIYPVTWHRDVGTQCTQQDFTDLDSSRGEKEALLFEDNYDEEAVEDAGSRDVTRLQEATILSDRDGLVLRNLVELPLEELINFPEIKTEPMEWYEHSQTQQVLVKEDENSELRRSNRRRNTRVTYTPKKTRKKQVEVKTSLEEVEKKTDLSPNLQTVTKDVNITKADVLIDSSCLKDIKVKKEIKKEKTNDVTSNSKKRRSEDDDDENFTKQKKEKPQKVKPADSEGNIKKLVRARRRRTTTAVYKKQYVITDITEMFKCTFCGRAYPSISILRQHMKHHTRPFQCSLCPKAFPTKTSLADHNKIHMDDKPYVCPVCGTRHIKLGLLKLHMRVHTDERPFTCEVCGKSFRRSNHLKQHRRLHSDVRPFQCSVCGQRCNDRSNLTRHMRRHTGETPYHCTECGRKFRDPSTFKLHRLRHDKKKNNLNLLETQSEEENIDISKEALQKKLETNVTQNETEIVEISKETFQEQIQPLDVENALHLKPLLNNDSIEFLDADGNVKLLQLSGLDLEEGKEIKLEIHYE